MRLTPEARQLDMLDLFLLRLIDQSFDHRNHTVVNDKTLVELMPTRIASLVYRRNNINGRKINFNAKIQENEYTAT